MRAGRCLDDIRPLRSKGCAGSGCPSQERGHLPALSLLTDAYIEHSTLMGAADHLRAGRDRAEAGLCVRHAGVCGRLLHVALLLPQGRGQDTGKRQFKSSQQLSRRGMGLILHVGMCNWWAVRAWVPVLTLESVSTTRCFSDLSDFRRSTSLAMPGCPTAGSWQETRVQQ
jgi:hypothetical protein